MHFSKLIEKEMSSSTSFVKFTALQGAKSFSGNCCYLLEIDECKILLDCGVLKKPSEETDDEASMMMDSEEDLKFFREIAPQIDCVLLSHADIEHLGISPHILT